jgi:hypothetical protein
MYKYLTPERRAEIEAMLNAASPAPWSWSAHEYYDGGTLRDRSLHGPLINANHPLDDPDGDGLRADADYALIASAPQVIRELLEVVDEMGEDLQNYEYMELAEREARGQEP